MLFICIVHYERFLNLFVFTRGIETIRLFPKLYLSLSFRAGSKPANLCWRLLSTICLYRVLHNSSRLWKSFLNPHLPGPCYTRPLGIESLRLFSEPALFGRTNRLASWNGKPGMHILGRNECLGNKNWIRDLRSMPARLSCFRSNIIDMIVPFKVIPFSDT